MASRPLHLALDAAPGRRLFFFFCSTEKVKGIELLLREAQRGGGLGKSRIFSEGEGGFAIVLPKGRGASDLQLKEKT